MKGIAQVLFVHVEIQVRPRVAVRTHRLPEAIQVHRWVVVGRLEAIERADESCVLLGLHGFWRGLRTIIHVLDEVESRAGKNALVGGSGLLPTLTILYREGRSGRALEQEKAEDENHGTGRIADCVVGRLSLGGGVCDVDVERKRRKGEEDQRRLRLAPKRKKRV